ncbi:hypothetical protein [Crocosphaera sp. Alani8]|uniref:hypothetical protein n=1 Tax=Crocosphaera sp. Alani8 TaxID=3038952 RepID=UPI00313D5052
MLHTTFELQRLSHTTTQPDTVRVLVFTVSVTSASDEEDYLFALPVEGVFKVIPCPVINWAMDTGLGMTDIGSDNITTLDLRQQFSFQDSQNLNKGNVSTVPNTYNFLILLKTNTEERYGIPVVEFPILSDIPLTTIRPLSLSYRQVAKLDFASHIAILPHTDQKKSIKIFLLGMGKIIEERLIKN